MSLMKVSKEYLVPFRMNITKIRYVLYLGFKIPQDKLNRQKLFFDRDIISNQEGTEEDTQPEEEAV